MATRKVPDYAGDVLQERGGGKGRPLSYEQINLILKLSASEGKTQVEIADIMGVTQPTVSRILSEFTDTSLLAKLRLKGSAELMAERVIVASQVAAARGDASPALEVLDRIDALPKRLSGASGGGPKVIVVVGSVTPPKLAEIIDIPALPDVSSA